MNIEMIKEQEVRNINIHIITIILVVLVVIIIPALYFVSIQTVSGGSITISCNGTYQIDLGSSLYSLKVVGPKIRPHNSTHIKVGMEVLIDNFSEGTIIDGVGSVKVYDSKGRQVGSSKMNMNIPPKGHVEEPLTLYVDVSQYDILNIFFNRTVLNYKLEAEFQSNGLVLSKIEKAVSIDLGTPIKDLRVGTSSKQSSNATHIKLIMPLNFTNDSGLIEVRGYMEVIALDGDENVVGFSDFYPLDVMPKNSLVSQLVLHLNTNTSSNEISKLCIIFHTGYGTVQKIISINA